MKVVVIPQKSYFFVIYKSIQNKQKANILLLNFVISFKNIKKNHVSFFFFFENKFIYFSPQNFYLVLPFGYTIYFWYSIENNNTLSY